MDAYLLDWANLLLRWLHVIVAIAWIGSSFYFVFLDNNLLAPTADNDGTFPPPSAVAPVLAPGPA